MTNWFTHNKQRSFCVLGLGLSGLSCVSFLVKQGIKPAVCDTRKAPPSIDALLSILPDVELTLGDITLEYLMQFNFVLMSPGVDPRAEVFVKAQQQGVQLINELELFAKANVKADVVAITGSNGKSTVVSLLGDVLNRAGVKTAVGGNIGRPALDLLTEYADCYVLELSSFQLEFCPSFAADVASVLNVSEDHMDRYHDLAEYAATKRNIYNNAKVCVFNYDDPLTKPEQYQIKSGGLSSTAQVVSFGLSEQADWQVINQIACLHQQSMYNLSQSPLVGVHNQLNMLVISAVAQYFELAPVLVAVALSQYSGLEHRCQRVSSKFNVTWINDSKATNVGATRAAISGLSPTLEATQGQLILIAGGVGKNADFTPLASVLKNDVAHLITIGRDGDQIAALKEAAFKVDTLEEAVQKAHELSQSGDMVLLSPACASLDMFNNFEHRGHVFVNAVEALA